MSEFVTPATLNAALVNISSSGDNTIIAAVAGKSITVHRVKILLASQTTVTFKDGASALSGPETCTYQILDFSDDPYYRTTAGNAFIINLGANVQCGGTIWYRLT